MHFWLSHDRKQSHSTIISFWRSFLIPSCFRTLCERYFAYAGQSSSEHPENTSDGAPESLVFTPYSRQPGTQGLENWECMQSENWKQGCKQKSVCFVSTFKLFENIRSFDSQTESKMKISFCYHRCPFKTFELSKKDWTMQLYNYISALYHIPSY